jgi:hypothetical protein
VKRFPRLLLAPAFACLVLVAAYAIADPGAPASALFSDATQELGIRFLHRSSATSRKYLPETMGSGVALLDYDDDGRLDLYFVNGAPIHDPTEPGVIPEKSGPEYWNRLYHQRKDGTFEDVTERANVKGDGYGMGVAVGDFNNDGKPDIYLTQYGHNILYRNNGDGTFTDITDKAGVRGSGWSTSALWIDYDNDGRLDLVVARYLEWDFGEVWCGERQAGHRAYCHPDLFKPITLLVYHNEGAERFREVSALAGFVAPGKTLGLAMADYDHDGFMDIVAANDSMPEFLFHNERNGTFREVGLESEMAVDGDGSTFAGMGVDFSDYDNDSWPDIFITTLANQKYALYRNTHDGGFTYSTFKSGLGVISLLHSGWGTHFFDFDNDGWKDLFVGQGHVLDTIEVTNPDLRYKESPLLLRNGAGRFVDVSAESGEVFSQRWAARGLAIGDINNDGKVDVVISTNNGPPHALLNQTRNANHWLTLKLMGVRSNRDGIGATILLKSAGGLQYETITTGGSYCSSSDARAHFGLGQAKQADEIEIRWPSGTVQHLTNVTADQIVRVKEPASSTR